MLAKVKRESQQDTKRQSTYRLVVERPNESVTIAIFRRGYRRLGLEDGVNATD